MNNAVGTRNVSACHENNVVPVPPGETLRGRCAHAHRPCHDKGCVTVTPGLPLPPTVPGEFVVHLGAGWGGSLHDLADEMGSFELGAEAAAAVLLSLIEWAEVEVQGFDDLLEGLRRLRGAVMVAAVCMGRSGDLPIQLWSEPVRPF